MEAFFAGLIGFLIGRGIPRKDAETIVKALQEYLGFEPPLGLTGYALEDMTKGKKYKASVVVRGKTYDAIPLEDIPKYSPVSVLGSMDTYLQVAPTLLSASAIEMSGVAVIPGKTEEVLSITGTGSLTCMAVHIRAMIDVPEDNMFIQITIDGKTHEAKIKDMLNEVASTTNTPTPITFTFIKKTASQEFYFWYWFDIPFWSSFKVSARNSHATDAFVIGIRYFYKKLF